MVVAHGAAWRNKEGMNPTPSKVGFEQHQSRTHALLLYTTVVVMLSMRHISCAWFSSNEGDIWCEVLVFRHVACNRASIVSLSNNCHDALGRVAIAGLSAYLRRTRDGRIAHTFSAARVRRGGPTVEASWCDGAPKSNRLTYAQVHVDNLGSIDTVVNIADDVEEDGARGTRWKKSEFYEAYEEVTGLLLYAVLASSWFSNHPSFSFREVAFFLFKVMSKRHSWALWLSYTVPCRICSWMCSRVVPITCDSPEPRINPFSTYNPPPPPAVGHGAKHN